MRALDHDIVSQRYFYPLRAPFAGATMVAANGESLACASVQRGHALTLVHFHGNGEVVDDYLPFYPELLDKLGVNAFLAEYRGYGGSTGVPRLAAMLDDVTPLIEAAGPPERLVIMGRSVGSIYAIECVRRFPQVAGLILESGIANVLDRILLRVDPEELGVTAGQLEAEAATLFDHRAALSAYKNPTLVLHAVHDDLVDKSHAERNAAWAGGEVTLELLPYGDHNSIFPANQARYLEVMKGFLDSLQS